MHKSLFALLALIVATFISTPVANACSCVWPPDVVEHYRGADHVIVGTVLGEREVGWDRIFRVRVHKTFKGCVQADETVYLSTPLQSATCGANFTIGKTYVFMGGDDGLWQGDQVISVNSCGFNMPINSISTADRRYLLDRPVTCQGNFVECANGNSPYQCLVDPCTVTQSCTSNTVCEANYCTGCTAEYYTANDQAVCRPW